jgi:hypothetical protein
MPYGKGTPNGGIEPKSVAPAGKYGIILSFCGAGNENEALTQDLRRRHL